MDEKTFLSKQVEKSGKANSEIARALNITPQAVGRLINYPNPKPVSVARVLRVLGWPDEEIAAIPLATVYDLS